MKIAIPPRRFLKNKYLIQSEVGFSWENSITRDSYVLGNSGSKRSIAPVFDLLGEKEPILVSEENEKAFLSLGVLEQDLPIDAVQSPSEMLEKIKHAFGVSKQALSELCELGYLDTFMKCNETLRGLQRAQIDINSLKLAIKKGEIKNVSIARGFYPNRDGFLNLPVYSITKTLTGRMTITSGPQILTAPKSIRKYLKSSYPGGKIAQIDFVSLEPRVGLQLTEQNLGRDIYEHLGEKLFKEKISRSVIKKLVLCAVYGASESTLRKGLSQEVNISKIVEKTKQILNYEMVVKTQSKAYEKTGKINNYFGRPITPQHARDSLLYNNYIQSSAVDVALLGFGKILRKSSSRVRPIFFIHDAMLVDLHPDDIEDFKKVSSSIFIEGLGEFPLDFQVLG